ncbi:MAG: deoxynucleoside kinase [Candidatus Promineifilaceae bacterium]|nr:deoxynucleoside kinase [Candidatus Promineifilaceae bacterium]
MHNNHKYVAIEGVIGIGKTTLARLLSNRFQSSILLEVFEENPFLADFYSDRARYAFQTQIFFLLSRYHQQHKAVPEALAKGMLISDYTFSKDELFAWLNLKDDELAMYGRVHAALSEKIPKPDLIVYLKAEHSVVMRRIALRDRPYERDMDPGYIRLLAEAYEAWLSNLTDIEVLTVEVNELDFLAEPSDLEAVSQQIVQALLHVEPNQQHFAAENEWLNDGRLASYQQFHRQLDEAKGFDPDLFFNYILLTEELGEIAKDLVKIWGESKHLAYEGRTLDEAREEAINRNRAGLRSELADLLAYTLKLANYTGIDLEQAYLDKMRQNLKRDWSLERTVPR